MRRIVRVVAVVVALCLLVVAGLVGTGRVQLRWDPPWFGLDAVFTDPHDAAATEARGLSAEDTAADGAGGPRVDLTGREMSAEEDDALPSRDQVARMEIGTVGRFAIPTLGMDVPLNEMSVVDGVATPPGFRAAYVLRGKGSGLSDPAGGRVIVAMHSAMHGFAPGNFLIDKESGASVVPEGTVLEVAGHSYRVRRSEAITKTALPGRADVWTDVPGTLVVITCRQVGGPKTTQNTVVWAELVS